MNQIESTLLSLVNSSNFLPEADPITGSASIIPSQLLVLNQTINQELNDTATDQQCTCGLCSTIPEEQPTEDDLIIETDVNNLLADMQIRITT